ncbi:hypothetical protein [Pseudarthrobacter sp. L1SW]|uniref:hypothetical protein n=1 Tax=Pseudarthrobacter sp. L1SW TaxID=2851598 RepID=UPI001E586388|nr:hypothetical protein [Pseudarthrobacter sp. L1SW]UEL28809.1 hypothetical protein KTR40_01185 [Pseudarthrobacter sp. L1SW]
MPGIYVHEATVLMDAGSGTGAPGAAITVALCGSWQHPPPCPLAAHHTAAQRDGETVTLRTIFTADPQREAEVRRRIDGALAHGSQAGPDGTVVRWTLVAAGPAGLTAEERGHGRRIAGT